MLSILPREHAPSLIEDQLLVIELETEPQVLEVVPINGIWRRRVPRRRITSAVMAVAALAVAAVGVWTWQRAVFDAVPIAPALPPLFATLAASGLEAPATAAANASLELADSFNIKVASFRAESGATAVAAGLVNAGFPAFPLQHGSAWDVIVGPYLSEAQTVGVRDRLGLYGHTGLELFVAEAGVTPNTEAVNTRVAHIALLRNGERMTLAIEMKAEPQKAVLRRLSARVLEIETGPVATGVRRLELEPSGGASAITHVSVREYRVRNRPAFVRARLTLGQPGHANVRIVGRIVYVDLS